MLGLLGVLSTATAIPSVIGVSQGIKAQRDQTRDAKLSRKCNLTVYCDARSRSTVQIHGKPIWMCGDKMYIGDTVGETLHLEDPGHPFEGFYINHPREPDKPMGMVTMTSSAPPAMGWVFVDCDTSEVKYGNKSSSMPHLVGPWGWTKDEVGVTLQKEEGFVAVQEAEGVWAVYWDKKGDGKGLPKGKKVSEISLDRRPIEEEEAEKKEGKS